MLCCAVFRRVVLCRVHLLRRAAYGIRTFYHFVRSVALQVRVPAPNLMPTSANIIDSVVLDAGCQYQCQRHLRCQRT